MAFQLTMIATPCPLDEGIQWAATTPEQLRVLFALHKTPYCCFEMQSYSSNVSDPWRPPPLGEVSAALLDLAPDGILAVDESGRVATVNTAAGRLLGHACEDIEGIHFVELLRPIPRGDGMSWLRDIQAMAGFVDVYALRSDGSLGSLQLAVRAVQFQGQVMFACYLRETRDRRRNRSNADMTTRPELRVNMQDRRQARAYQREAATVYIVVADSSLRAHLATTLQRCGWTVKSFALAQSFLAHSPPSAPGCVVLDMELPDLNGSALQVRMASGYASLPVIFITDHGDVSVSVRAMKAGAFGFFTRPLHENDFLTSIRDATDFSRSVLERAEMMQTLDARYASLTAREREVMLGVVSGLLNKQVAFHLGISEVTVKAHRGRVMRKMQAHSVAELVKLAELVEKRALRTN